MSRIGPWEDRVKNNNCDGGSCRAASGEVRVLPIGGGGNLILCRDCYDHEITWRKSPSAKGRFDLPLWESLEIYMS